MQGLSTPPPMPPPQAPRERGPDTGLGQPGLQPPVQPGPSASGQAWAPQAAATGAVLGRLHPQPRQAQSSGGAASSCSRGSTIRTPPRCETPGTHGVRSAWTAVLPSEIHICLIVHILGKKKKKEEGRQILVKALLILYPL